MRLALALLVPVLSLRPGAQASGTIPPTPYDRVIDLELTADDPELIDGRGRTVVVEYEVEFDGTLHLWTSSELDLFLRVEDTRDGSLVAEDDDSGGRNVPYVKRTVEEGERFAVLIASSAPDAFGSLALHVLAAPETEATREATLGVADGLAEARRLQQDGDADGARSLVETLLSELLSTPGSGQSEAVAEACVQLARVACAAGDLPACRAAREATRVHRERTLPEDHSDLLTARHNLAITLGAMGDLAGARALKEAVLEARERTLPEDDLRLVTARQNLAATLREMGDLRGARALFEAVLAARERTLPADHPELLAARQNLAVTLGEAGDLRGARALEEAVLAASERTLPEDHPQLIAIRQNLAVTVREMGDLAVARALQETVLAASERTLPEDHPELLAARQNLAITMREMGDLPGARALQEAVLEAYERTLPADHPRLLRARQNLAVTIGEMGDLPGARAIEEAVLAACERTLPEDHPQVRLTRQNLAATMAAMGDLAGALALQEALLEACERTLPLDHPLLLDARSNVAATRHALDDFAGAGALFESVLEARERTLPADHPDLLRTRANLAATRMELGDLPGARNLIRSQVAGMRARVLASLALAPRQAREAVAAETARLASALFLTRGAGPDLEATVFAFQETLRMVAGESARALRAADDPEVRAWLDEAARVRVALADLAAHTSAGDPRAHSAELTRLLQERDRLEREASRRMAAHGVAMSGVDVGALGQALGERSALVTYRRIARLEQAAGKGRLVFGRDHLLAHVLAPGGALVRIDLGEAAELEDLVLAWRRALGRPLRGRGVALVEERVSADDRSAGEALRKRLVDPILAQLDEQTDTLHVCADDLVFLVALDALPIEDRVLGDRYRFVNEVSCARLLSGRIPEHVAPGLLLVGGVDYGASADEAHTVVARAEVDLRSAAASFAALPGTRAEADALRERFDAAFDAEALLLVGDAATKEALAAGALGKRWMHVATHGWFAPEAIKSTLDEQPRREDGRGWATMGFEERVTGMAPMLLCGLALAGANRPMDSLGRRAGILTAEELCSLDLSACELAVLSACETNVGIRRAGQGIQSLQAALYAAGARSSITSLWKVDDAATRRLFELFYTKLWEEQLPKAQALWEAKKVLRDEGAPVRDWAAWVLTGDPD